jgi:DNA-binding LytR/AlgR family response regulator
MAAVLTKLDRKRPGWRLELAAVAGIGLFLGALGPFGSYLTAPFPARAAWWTGALLLGTLLFGTTARAVIGRRMALPATLAALTAAAAVAALPFAAAVAWAARAIWPHLRALGFLDWYSQVLIVAAPMLLAAAFLARRRPLPASAGEAQAAASAALLGVNPSDVLCLQMEDHYVRVHTASGSHLVLATMQQAIAALGGAAGLQVHRSWWVAAQAVAGVGSEGRNLRLKLRGGLVAPVARSSVAAVRAAGWLERMGAEVR